MKEILYHLIGLNQYIAQYHWLAAGYENHILADKLADGLDDEIDELAELLLATENNENDFTAKELLVQSKQTVENAYTGTDMVETLKSLAELFGKILILCDRENENDITKLAFADFRGRLSNSILRKLYLIQIQLKK